MKFSSSFRRSTTLSIPIVTLIINWQLRFCVPNLSLLQNLQFNRQLRCIESKFANTCEDRNTSHTRSLWFVTRSFRHFNRRFLDKSIIHYPLLCRWCMVHGKRLLNEMRRAPPWDLRHIVWIWLRNTEPLNMKSQRRNKVVMWFTVLPLCK